MHTESSTAKVASQMTDDNQADQTASKTHDWTEKKERGCLASLKIMVWIATTFGRRVSRAFLYPIVAYYMLTAPSAVAASRRYLVQVFGRQPRHGEIFQHLFTFASVLLDRVYFLLGHKEKFDVRVVYDQYMEQEESARGTGVFMMGAHMGSFEVVRMVSRDCDELKLVLLMYEDNARKIGALMSAINPAAQQEIVALGNLSAMLTVRDRLAEGALVGILADRSIREEKTIKLPFMGLQAPFALGPFRMAAMMRRPVYMMGGLYLGGNRYDIYIEKIADFSDAEDGTRRNLDVHITAAMTRYVARLEYFARLAPYNWFNFYDFWQGDAP